jgi:hypothetical protein
MMAIAASKAASRVAPSEKLACKPRASCLKPKETRKIARAGHRRFDLRQSLNYLKVKTTGRNPANAPVAPVSVLPTGVIAS